jgi:molybdate transport system regulatory protein
LIDGKLVGTAAIAKQIKVGPGGRCGSRPPKGAAKAGRPYDKIAAMAKLSLRVDFNGADSVGPGKIRLLELLKETGSIAAAGRAMDMSYRRAWLLIDALNHSFRQPVVATKLGGTGGGGAELTAFGEELVSHYRDMETVAYAALRPHLSALERALAPGGGSSSSDETEASARSA